MKRLRDLIVVFTIIIIVTSMYSSIGYTADDGPDDNIVTTTTQIITVINGPADSGGVPTTTEYQCFDLSYNGLSPFPPGIGQDNNFQQCVLETYCEHPRYPDTYYSCAETIEPEVQVIDPPLPSIINPEPSVIKEYSLPSTGLNEIIIVVALVAMAFGLMLMLVAIRKSNIK